MLEYFYLFIVSFISNLFSAFSGGGAGIIQLPAILFIFNTSFITALSTHKIATVALGIGASLRFLKTIKIDRQKFSLMLLIGIPSVILGANYISLVEDHLARNLLGFLIIIIFLYSIFQKNKGYEKIQYTTNINNNIIGFLVISIIGFINGSLSAGTGLLFTMWLVGWFGMTYKEAVAYTLIIVGFFYNFTGAITLSIFADISWDILPSLILGSLLGGYLGAHFSLSKNNRTIKVVYQLVTLTVGIKLIFY